MLEIKNNDQNDVQLSWMQEKQRKELIVKGRSVLSLEIEISSPTYPSPIAFQATDLKNNSEILLRGRHQLLLIPRRYKVKEVIVIGTFCMHTYEIFR